MDNGCIQLIDLLPFNKLLKLKRKNYINVEFSEKEKKRFFLT